jgi:hypothetical protein
MKIIKELTGPTHNQLKEFNNWVADNADFEKDAFCINGRKDPDNLHDLFILDDSIFHEHNDGSAFKTADDINYIALVTNYKLS